MGIRGRFARGGTPRLSHIISRDGPGNCSHGRADHATQARPDTEEATPEADCARNCLLETMRTPASVAERQESNGANPPGWVHASHPEPGQPGSCPHPWSSLGWRSIAKRALGLHLYKNSRNLSHASPQLGIFSDSLFLVLNRNCKEALAIDEGPLRLEACEPIIIGDREAKYLVVIAGAWFA